MKAGKSAPRFLPTLTQVVSTATPNAPEAGLPASDVAGKILQRMLPLVEENLRLGVEQLIRSHMDGLRESLRAEIQNVLESGRSRR